MKSEGDATNEVDDHLCLADTNSLPYASHCSWMTDCRATANMAYNKEFFFKIGTVSLFNVGMGDFSGFKLYGRHTLHLMLF